MLAEGLAIVLSILLAFAVQAWWEGWRERGQEVDSLPALRAEAEEVRRLIPDRKSRMGTTLHAVESLVRQFPGNSLAPPDSLVNWLGEAGIPQAFSPPRAVLDDVVSSGRVQSIRSDPIRLAIANYQAALESHRLNLEQAQTLWLSRIEPHLAERVSRADRLRQGPYARLEGGVPFAPSPFAPDYCGLFSDRVFESMLAERWLRLTATGRRLARLGERVAEVIDRQLGPG